MPAYPSLEKKQRMGHPFVVVNAGESPPQGLKPVKIYYLCGTAEAVPFHKATLSVTFYKAVRLFPFKKSRGPRPFARRRKRAQPTLPRWNCGRMGHAFVVVKSGVGPSSGAKAFF